MSKSKQGGKSSAGPIRSSANEAAAATPAPFQVSRAVWWLLGAVILVYFSSLSLGYTDLDDVIFIRDFRAYNEDMTNLYKSFGRGLFDAVKDPYYRPLFSDAMILNYRASGLEPFGYHLVNIVLHGLAVLLLYRLTVLLRIGQVQGFIIALIFAVHPVLTQTVAWIPGRNDTLLAVFVLSFINRGIRYATSGQRVQLVWSGVFLLLAFFTKETAVFAAPALFILLVLYRDMRWREPLLVHQYIVWVACFLIWYAARAAATIAGSGIGSAASVQDFIHRLPVIIQYLGKVFLPFNLSVFPTQEDTSLLLGVVAVILLAVAVVLKKDRNLKAFAAGLIVFLLFLMPALLVPDELNKQTFEHRLYLPLVGILLLLPHTILLGNSLQPRQLLIAWGGVAVVFAGLTYGHQHNFSDPVTFWTQAVETSPRSAYANMMLAARLDKSRFAESEAMFRKAYALNPKEKYLNFYMAEMLQRKDSVQASEPYLLAEKQISDYVQCDFLLARVYMERGDKQAAITSLERFLGRDRYNEMAHNNLLLLLMDTQQADKARQHVAEMSRLGISIPPQLRAQLGM